MSMQPITINIPITIRITPAGIELSDEPEADEEDGEEPTQLRVLSGGVGFQLTEPDDYEGTYVD